jgi:hypothetical protein
MLQINEQNAEVTFESLIKHVQLSVARCTVCCGEAQRLYLNIFCSVKTVIC